MREYTSPDGAVLAPGDNLTDLVFRPAAEEPDAPMFARRVDNGWVDVPARQFATEVTRLAKGLIAAGVAPGDRVGLLSKTRYEWSLVDFAILAIGAATVPIYETSAPEQLAWNLTDSDAVALVLETDAHRAAYDEIRDRLPGLRAVWQIDSGDLDRLAETGAAVPDHEVTERRAALRGDTLATVIYTSGTTGRPKGCELTHANFLFDAVTTTGGMPTVFTAGSSTLLFLPLAHVFARLIQFGCLATGVRLGHSPNVADLLPDLATSKPTFLLAVPRVFEKLHAGAQARARAGGAPKRRLFERAERTAIRWSEALDRGGPGVALRAEHRLLDRLVYAKLRASLGGDVRYVISGGAPLATHLGHFFRGAGVTVIEGWGLTETSAAATANRPGALRLGTVGQPIPGTSIRIGDDGEVLYRGGNVFRGYWRNETATKEYLDPDGWLHTGDLGELDDDGFLRLTGRKKELLVTAGGKNVAPGPLEDALRGGSLISHCLVVGDRRPYVAALLTLDAEALAQWKAERGKPADAGPAELRDDPELRAELQRAVDAANRRVSRAEGIKRFRVLPVDFTEAGGELTPTMKLKRRVVLERYAAEVDALYAG